MFTENNFKWANYSHSLGHNRFGLEGVNIIASSLEKTCVLTDLEWVSIVERESKLNNLNSLSLCEVGIEGAVSLADALKKNVHLIRLKYVDSVFSWRNHWIRLVSPKTN